MLMAKPARPQMNLYLDDDMVKASLVARLRRAGHQVVLPSDAALASAWDPRHLLHAVQHRLLLVSKNHDDFRDQSLAIGDDSVAAQRLIALYETP